MLSPAVLFFDLMHEFVELRRLILLDARSPQRLQTLKGLIIEVAVERGPDKSVDNDLELGDGGGDAIVLAVVNHLVEVADGVD